MKSSVRDFIGYQLSQVSSELCYHRRFPIKYWACLLLFLNGGAIQLHAIVDIQHKEPSEVFSYTETLIWKELFKSLVKEEFFSSEFSHSLNMLLSTALYAKETGIILARPVELLARPLTRF